MPNSAGITPTLPYSKLCEKHTSTSRTDRGQTDRRVDRRHAIS